MDQKKNFIKHTHAPLISNIKTNNIKDSGHLVYLLFGLLGIITLLPWNVYLSATQYFIDKFKNVTFLKNNFTFLTSISFQTINLLSSFILIFLNLKNSSSIPRVAYSLCGVIIVLIYHTILTRIDTDMFTVLFFISCCISASIFAFCTTVLQTELFNLTAKSFTTKYINAVVMGSNVSGIYVSLLNIFIHFFNTSIKTMATIYFGFATMTAVFSLVFVKLIVDKNPYFIRRILITSLSNRLPRYDDNCININQQTEKKPSLNKTTENKTIISFIILISIFINFCSTLAGFPTLAFNVLPNNKYFFSTHNHNYFIDVVIVLTFNACSFFGNMLAQIIFKYLKINLKMVIILMVLTNIKSVFTILIYLFMKNGSLNIPTIITNDYVFWLLHSTISLVFGLITGVCFLFIGKLVAQYKLFSLPKIASFILILGVICGINFGMLLKYILY